MLEHFEVERAAFADDDVVGRFIDDGVAVHVQGVEQAAFADDVRGAVRLLASEEAGGRHCAREDVLLFDGHAHALQLGGDVAARALAVVREEQERDVPIAEHANEIHRAGDELAAAVDDAVHVDQKSFSHYEILEVAIA